jgi:hypothetical protein
MKLERYKSYFNLKEAYKVKGLRKGTAEKLLSKEWGPRHVGYTDDYFLGSPIIVPLDKFSTEGLIELKKKQKPSDVTKGTLNNILNSAKWNKGKKAYYYGMTSIAGHPVVVYYNSKNDEYVYLNGEYLSILTAMYKGKSNQSMLPKYIDYDDPLKALEIYPDTLLQPIHKKTSDKELEAGDEFSDQDKKAIRYFLIGKDMEGKHLRSENGYIIHNGKEIAKMGDDGIISIGGYSLKSKIGDMLLDHLKKLKKPTKIVGSL